MRTQKKLIQELLQRFNNLPGTHLYVREGVRKEYRGMGNCSALIISGDILRPNTISISLGTPEGVSRYAIKSFGYGTDLNSSKKLQLLLTELPKDPTVALCMYGAETLDKTLVQKGMRRVKSGNYIRG